MSLWSNTVNSTCVEVTKQQLKKVLSLHEGVSLEFQPHGDLVQLNKQFEAGSRHRRRRSSSGRSTHRRYKKASVLPHVQSLPSLYNFEQRQDSAGQPEPSLYSRDRNSHKKSSSFSANSNSKIHTIRYVRSENGPKRSLMRFQPLNSHDAGPEEPCNHDQLFTLRQSIVGIVILTFGIMYIWLYATF